MVLGAATVSAASPGLRPVTITIAVARSDAIVPFELGLQQGTFRAAGLDVRLLVVGSTAQAIASVSGGAAQFGVGDPASVLVYATDRPAPLELVSGVTATKRGFTGLLTTTATRIRDAAETYGKKIGVPELDGIDRLATQVWLDENGSDTNSVTFVQVASSNARRALARGYVDAVLVDQPELSALAGAPGIHSLGDVENGLLGSDAAASAAFSTSGFLRSSAGYLTAVRFVHALARAITFAAGHPKAVAAALNADAGWPASVAARLSPDYSATIDTFVLEQIAESQYAYDIATDGQPNLAALVWAKAAQ